MIMKKVLITIVLISAGLILIAQSATQTDDMANLKKQVSSLEYKNAKLAVGLNALAKTSKINHDSIMVHLNATDLKVTSLSDTLAVKDSLIMALKVISGKNKSEIKAIQIVHLIIFILILILVFVVYLKFQKKFEILSMQVEANILKTKEELEKKIGEIKK